MSQCSMDPARRLAARRGSTIGMAAAAMVAIALAACQSPPPSGQPAEERKSEERKSPFATGNVSVAPQIEGRPAAPTPVPAPRPTLEP